MRDETEEAGRGQGGSGTIGAGRGPGGTDAPREVPTTESRLPAALASLGHRNYRLLWFGTLVSSTGDWMDQVALNWLIYQLTGSPVALGLFNLFRLTPILVFTLIGGVIADRVERRRLMFTTQSVAMLLAFALAILVSTGLVEFWHVLVVGIGRGIMLSFNQPARQSLISELVPPRSLMNAIALNQATLNLSRVFGPALGGFLIATVGVAGAFYLNGASFLAVLASLTLMRFADRARPAHRSVLADLAGGLRYVRGEPSLRDLVVLGSLPMILGMPYMTMLTVFASDALKVGGSGLGLLTACTGVGAVTGALFVASRQQSTRRGRLMIAGICGFGLTLLLFSASPWLWLSVLAVTGVGAAQQVFLATNNTLIQVYVRPEFRGRVLSTLFLSRGLVPLGTMFAGFGAALVGVQWTTGSMAAGLVIMALIAWRFAPTARDLA